jgi:tellurite resistance protein TerA
LSSPGEISVVNPPAGGLPNFQIAVAWDNVKVEEAANPVTKLFKKKVLREGVDLDLGCLYKLKNGLRGGMQAFGNLHGSLEKEPFIALSSDERTGDREGPDEMILVNGMHWHEIEKILIYVYIYDGAVNWAAVRPQVQVRVPGEQPMIVTLNTAHQEMEVCAVAGIENVRGGIKMTSYLEYFPGHSEMDRAFGFGLEWEGGTKDT